MSSMIQPVSSPVSGAAQTPAAAGTREVPQVQRAKDQLPARPQSPAMDEYIPEEERAPSGRYWLEKDEDGQPRVYFDSPEDKGPEKKAAGKRVERCTGSTDRVDREIERLKQRKGELERQISAEADGSKIKALEQKLAQVERELAQKDNDAYRRQHTVFS